MGKRIKDYVAAMILFAEKFKTENGTVKQNKDEILREMLVQIGFFQHERLIHLIVTVLFAFLTIFTIACSCFLDSSYGMLFCLLCVLCLILLVPYIHHYYVLENGVQKLYEVYDEIKNTPINGTRAKDEK